MTDIILPPVFVSSSWGDEMLFEDEMKDAKYIAMKRPEWENEKRNAKVDKRFKSWNEWLAWASRIDNKRMMKSRLSTKVVERSELSYLLDTYDDYMKIPSAHFRDQKHMDREINKIEKEILACVGGKDALNRMKIKYADFDAISETEELSDSDDDSIDLTRLRRY